MAFEGLGRLFIYIGVILVLIGGFFLLVGKLPWLGKLPGDIVVRRDGLTIFIPITTMVVISIVLTIFFNIFLRR